MTGYWQDPELNRLVGEINSGQRSSVREEEKWAPRRSERGSEMEPGPELRALLSSILRRRASDLHLVSAHPPAFRIQGEIRFSDQEPLTEQGIVNLFDGMAERHFSRLESEGAVDFAFRALMTDGATARFRVNLHSQRGSLAASVRLLPSSIPSLEQLHLPASLSQLTRASHGLVLVCGPTGSGKSSTLAALVEEINVHQARHVITVEDPIEYEHRSRSALVEQVEVGRDAASFASALKAALRQDPDVILVGEMRDWQTAATALTAAETGHLIFSTLHTGTPEQAIHRIVDLFPAEQQNQVYKQLALSLRAILCQKLIPSAGASIMVPAVELLLTNAAVKNHVRKGRIENLQNEITLGKRLGMITLEDSLASLIGMGLLTLDEASECANHPEEIGRVLGG